MQDIFESSVVAESRELIAEMATFTETFLNPFHIAHAMEAEMGLNNWMIRFVSEKPAKFAHCGAIT